MKWNALGLVAAIAVLPALISPGRARAQTIALSADSAWARGDRLMARRLYLERFARDSTDAAALFRLARLEAWQRDHRASIAWLDRLIRLYPQDRDALVARAHSIAALGDLATATAIVDSILALHPTDIGALHARARFSAWDGDLAGSERLWREARTLDPSNVESAVGLSQTLRWQGRVAEAGTLVEPAVQRAPHDVDARIEHDWVAQSLRPRIRSGLTWESDSDGNGIASFTFGATTRLTPSVELRADGWLRSAGLDGVTANDAIARGGYVTAAMQLSSGWAVDAGAGASMSTENDASVLAAFAAGITTPRRNRAILNLAVSRTPWDYSWPLVRNEVVVDEARATLDVRARRPWTFAFATAIAGYDVRRAGTSSRRVSGQAAVTRRLSDPLSVTLTTRAFGFDHDVNGGFFDPDFYGVADVALALHRESVTWTFDGDLAPGLQQIGSGGDITGAVRATGTLAWVLRPGRRIVARAAWANTGLQQLTAGASGSYRYTSFALGFNWWF